MAKLDIILNLTQLPHPKGLPQEQNILTKNCLAKRSILFDMVRRGGDILKARVGEMRPHCVLLEE